MFLENTKEKYKKSSKKTISGYKKHLVFKGLYECVKHKDSIKAIYFLNEIIASGYFDDLFYFFFNFHVKYIHIHNMALLFKIINTYKEYQIQKQTLKTVNMTINIRENTKYIRDCMEILKNILYTEKKNIYGFLPGSFLPENNQITLIPGINYDNISKKDLINIIKHYDNKDEQIISNTFNSLKIAFVNFMNDPKKKTSVFYYLHIFIYENIQILDIETKNKTLFDKSFFGNHTYLAQKYIPELWKFFVKFALVKFKNNPNIKKQIMLLYDTYKSSIVNTKELLLIASLIFLNNADTLNQHLDVLLEKEYNYFIYLYSKINNAYLNNKPRKDFLKIYENEEEKKKDDINEQKKEIQKIITEGLVDKNQHNFTIIKAESPVTKVKTKSPKKKTPVKTPVKKPEKKVSKKSKKKEEPPVDKKVLEFAKIINKEYELTEDDIQVSNELQQEVEIEDDVNNIKVISIN